MLVELLVLERRGLPALAVRLGADVPSRREVAAARHVAIGIGLRARPDLLKGRKGRKTAAAVSRDRIEIIGSPRALASIWTCK